MKLFEFRDETIRIIKEFFFWWYKKHRENKIKYPLKLTEQEWRERFYRWELSRKNK